LNPNFCPTARPFVVNATDAIATTWSVRTIKRTIDQPTTRPLSEIGQHDLQFLRLFFHAYPAQLPNPLEECARCTFLCGDVRAFFIAFLNVWIDFHRRSPDLNLDGVYQHLHDLHQLTLQQAGIGLGCATLGSPARLTKVVRSDERGGSRKPAMRVFVEVLFNSLGGSCGS
jgi:hypothetical protein